MNKRQYIERLLELIPDSYNETFNKMYPNGLEAKQVAWATKQVENSIQGLSESLVKSRVDAESNVNLVAEQEATIKSLRAALEASVAKEIELNRTIYHLESDPDAVNAAEVSERLDILDALEAGGVDNWEWYEESIKEYEKTRK